MSRIDEVDKQISSHVASIEKLKAERFELAWSSLRDSWSCNVRGCGKGKCVHEVLDERCPVCKHPVVRVKTTGVKFCSNHEAICEWCKVPDEENSMNTKDTIDSEIQELQDRIRQLEEKKNNQVHQDFQDFQKDFPKPMQDLADQLHKLLCKANHEDGCGYYYEKWDPERIGSIKKREMGRVKALLAMPLTQEQIADVISILRKVE